MICPTCASEVPDGRAECPSCRAPLEEPSLRATAISVPAAPSFGTRYAALGLLGEGGMGAVYKVQDRELNRVVALKVIRPEIASRPGVLERFRREIGLASRVTHRNVLRVHDLGEAEGTRFLTMEYVDGEDLAGVIRREGRLSPEQALEIACQAAAGLAAAHEQGVVHRDLKPQNVLVGRDGRVAVADFGLATTAGAEAVTATGVILGTPAYMAPEQVQGGTVDARSDVYAFGAILYEMLSGRPPFEGRSAFEAMLRKTQEPPPPLATAVPDAPPWLQALVARCLERDPARRYADAGALLQDLLARTSAPVPRGSHHRHVIRFSGAGLAVGALLLAGAVGGASWIWRMAREGKLPAPASAPEAEAAAPLVGVLPFENRTGDPSLDVFGPALARLVADGLSGSRHLRVVAPERAAALKDRPGVSVVTGELLPSGAGEIVVAARLAGGDGRDLASERVEASRTRIASAADRIAAAVRKGMNVPLTENVAYLAADFAARNPEAWREYAQGLEDMVAFRYAAAENHFAAALRAAPDYAMARYRLAFIRAGKGETEQARADIARAEAEARRLSPREAAYVRAMRATIERKDEEAIRLYRELIAAHPYEYEARALLGQLLLDLGDTAGARTVADELEKLEPDAPVARSLRGHAALAERDYARAVRELKEYVRLEPGSANGRHVLGDAYASLGERDLAAAEYREALKVDPGFHFSTVNLGVVEALAGRVAEGDAVLHRLADGDAPIRFRIDAAFQRAYLLRSLGRFREAAEALREMDAPIRAEQVRSPMAWSVRGLALAEAGDPAGRQLLERAVDAARAMGAVPTRYLFAWALADVRDGRMDAARRRVREILKNALPPEDPDRTEEKAAAYLEGLAFLREMRTKEALERFARAVDLQGHPYAIPHLGLARAHLRAEQPMEALAAARQAEAFDHPDGVTLEPELDRARARLVRAQAQAALGQADEARATAQAFLARWKDADPGLPELAEARTLAR